MLIEQSPTLVGARDRSGRTPLLVAALNGSAGMTEALVKAGADIDATNEWNETALHTACHNADETIARLLLDYGANHKICDCLDRTPLWVIQSSTQQGAREIVGLLKAADRLVSIPPLLSYSLRASSANLYCKTQPTSAMMLTPTLCIRGTCFYFRPRHPGRRSQP